MLRVGTKTASINLFDSISPILPLIEYNEKHYKIGYNIYRKICKYYGILDCEKCYIYQPQPITYSKEATTFWNLVIQTYRNQRIIIFGTLKQAASK